MICFLASSRSVSVCEVNRISGRMFKAPQIFKSVYKFGMFLPVSMQLTWFWESPAANDSSIWDIFAFTLSSFIRERIK